MKKNISIKRIQFYLFLGGIWLLFCTVGNFLIHNAVFTPKLLNEIWRLLYLLPVNFVFFEFGLPFISRKKPISLAVLIGIVFTVFYLATLSFGLYFWRNLGLYLHIYTSFRHSTLIPGDAYSLMVDEAQYQAETGFLSVLFFGIANLFYRNFQLKQTAQKLRLEKQEAELDYLKSQTNPHFLFNTLNNIYVLAKDKSDQAPESILRLSNILRFMLYETGGSFINLSQEQKIISDYISLEKLRYDDSLSINFESEIDDPEQLLPPLLLVPLVENAFKHGVSEVGSQSFVTIQLLLKAKQLSFTVKNSTEKSLKTDPVKENIGLSNLKRQLELLYADYTLVIKQDEAVFTVILQINLSSHV